MLKMGIIGMGKMGEFHAGWMTPENQLELVAVCEKKDQRRNYLKSQYPNLRFYQDVDEFLKKEDLDFVVIVTTHETHEDLAIKSLDAGKNVIVEKPMSMTHASTLRMIKAAEKNKKFLFVHQSSRWDRDFLLLKDIINSGKIGDLLCIQSKVTLCDEGWPHWGIEGAENPWRIKAKYGGGMLYDWGPHLVDEMLILMKQAPSSVYGILQSGVWTKEVDDYFFATFRFGGDIIFQIECSNNARLPAPRWLVIGTKGTFLVPGKKDPVWGEAELKYVKDNREQILEKYELIGVKESGIEGGFYRDLVPFIEGKKKEFVSMYESSDVVNILEMIKQSSKENRIISYK
jgi:scyllo-inositol 2-dehydrogenase (NADP+)